MAGTTTPVSLLERLRQPAAQAAWGEFVDLYTPLLYFWALRLGLQEPDAADLVQDVFLLLYQKLPEFSYEGNKSFRSWLRTVLLNKWRDRQRRAALPMAPGGAVLAEVPARAEGDEVEEAEYRQHLVSRALEVMQAEFQPTTWRACWEHVVAGRPAADVAQELGITVNAVYLAKSRVLSRLRKELEGLLD